MLNFRQKNGDYKLLRIIPEDGISVLLASLSLCLIKELSEKGKK